MRGRTRFSQKLMLIAAGILLCIVMLEAGLRLAGFMYASFQEYRNYRSLRKGNPYRIMCIGESTTAMGGELSYPSQLEDALNHKNRGISFSVVNKGVTGMQTTYILDQLERNLKKYKPAMVVAMMGINDSNIFDKYKNSHEPGMVVFLKSLRVYKLGVLLGEHMAQKGYEIFNLKEGRLIRMPLDIIKENELKRSLKNNPSSDTVYSDYAQFCVTQNRLSDAERMLEAASLLNGDHFSEFLSLAWFYKQRGFVKDAERVFKKIIAMNTKSKVSLLNIDYISHLELGRLYRETRRFDEAEKVFEDTKNLPLISEVVFIETGSLYEDLLRFEEAEDNYKKALQINPGSYPANMQMGRYMRRKKEYEVAEDYFRQAARSKPSSVDPVIGLLWTQYDSGSYESLRREMYKVGPQLPYSKQVNACLKELGGRISDQNLVNWAQKNLTELSIERHNFVTYENYHSLKNILDKKGIRLVCVQYPMRSIKPLRKIFDGEEGVIFVDNEQVFKKKVDDEGYKEYFIDMFGGDFGHCTPKGNRLLAENIAQAIAGRVFGE